MKRLAVLLLLLFGGSADAYSSGAPFTACSSLTPGHGGSPQSSSSPYTLDLSIFDFNDSNYYYEPGQTYQLTLSGGGTTFRGFLLQARLTADDATLTGTFSNPVSGSQLSSCSPTPAAGLTHSSNSDKMSITGTWTAPSLGSGPIRFRYAVVQVMPTYWANIMSDVIYESGTNLVYEGMLLANNSLVVRGDVGEGENGITCTSESADCCSDPDTSGWFSPTGDPLHEGADGASDLYLTRGPGSVRLNRITGGTSALYWCDIPDSSGELQRFYVGLYTGGLASGAYTSIEVSFELETEVTEDPPRFSLTCTTEGGPATNVEWERDGVAIEDDANHSSSQIVVDAVDAEYDNVLVVTGRNGGEYSCTVSHARTSIIGSIQVEVGTEAINLTAVQEDISGTSIIITWDLPSSPAPTASGFTVMYETSEPSETFSTGLTERSLTRQGLMTGSTYSISIITQSTHLPSGLVGPVNVTLATGCVGLGYTNGCCVDSGSGDSGCILDLAGTEGDCDCSEECYSLGNCCLDILLSCPPPPDANLCVQFRGYGCDENAECVSVGGVINDSSSYQCVCTQGYVGDGNTTCIGDSVNVSHSVVLATNGSSAVLTCEAQYFIDSPHYWMLVGDKMAVAVGKTLELDQILFAAVGDKYQCIVSTPYGNITSELAEIIVSPQGGLSVQPPVVSTERGDTVTLTCGSLGGPENTFSWVQPPSNTPLSSEASLNVSVSSGRDGGVYICSVRNEAGNDSTDAIINVAAVFEQSPASVTAEVGGNVSLQCTAEGYPPPTTVQWLHYDTVIGETDSITIDEMTVNSTAVVSTLELSGLSTVQYGQYHCRANGGVDSEPAAISFTGNFSVGDCEELHNITSNVTEVGTRGTVCFQCPEPGSVLVWTINDQSVSSSVGTDFSEGVLAVFLAAQVFSVDSLTLLGCLTDNSVTTQTFVTLQDLPQPVVEITASSNDSVVGQLLTLTCSVTIGSSLTTLPEVEFLGPSGGPIITGGRILMSGPTTSGAVTTVQVEIQSLTASDGGQYTCRATTNAPGTSEAYTVITVTLPEPDVTVAPVSDGSTIPYAGVEYGLMCGVDFNESYVGMMGAEVVIVWRNSEGDPVISDARVSVSQTEAVPGEGGFRSTLTFSPLSLSDTGDYVCSAVYTPDPSWSFVTPSSPGEDTYTVNVAAPPLPNLTVSINGSGVAGEPLEIVCVSQFIQDLVIPPSVGVLDPLNVQLEEGLATSSGEGIVSVSALLDPLLTSHAGIFTCVSTYNISEAGLDDAELYSATQSIPVNVSIPAPQVVLAPVPTETYIGAVTSLYCTVRLDATVNTAIEVTTSIAPGSNSFTLANELGDNIYQSGLVFSPLTTEDTNEYVCSVMAQSSNEHITRATAEAVYSLVPLDTPEPLVTISLDQSAAVLGTNGSLVCSVTTIPGLLHPPIIEWVELPDPANTTVEWVEGEGNTFWHLLHFDPTLERHGGLYTCSATLSFPNTTIATVTTTRNFTLVVQAPVPEIEITQDPEGDIVVESGVSLTCNASIPQPNSLTFSVTINWTNPDMSTVGNSSDARVLVSQTVETTPHEFISRLTLSAVSPELDSVYVCTAETSGEGSGEFVSTQSATRNLSLVIVGPPVDFIVESKTPTNLSFSWGLPMTPGEIVSYLLECSTEVTGVSHPPPVNTTDQTGTVLSLSPGVPYTCTLTALTVSNTPPPATLNATTLESAPSGPPVGFSAEPVGARNVSFSWQPPEPHLQNGVIIKYIITCTPNPLSPLSPMAEAIGLTVGGFSPLTSYNCSVRATNSAGSGPPAYISVTTEDDSVLIQVKVLGVGDCVSWKAQDEDAKRDDLTSAIVDNINKRCDCSFTSDSILEGQFQCFGSVSDSVTFRGLLRGTAAASSLVLASHVADWVATGQTILLQNVHFRLESECQDEVVIEELLSPECAPPRATGDPSSSRVLSLSLEAVVGVSAGGLLVVAGLIVSVVVIITCWRRHRLIKVDVRGHSRNVTSEKGSTELLQSHRRSTASADSELIYNEQYTSFIGKQQPEKPAADPLKDNPLYSNPVVANTKLDDPLPPLPEVDSDGYAAVLPLNMRSRAMTSPAAASDYLKPVVSPQHTKEIFLPPPDNSAIFENRSSGIYEDPDYTPTSKRRSASLSQKTATSTTAAAGSPARSVGRADTFVSGGEGGGGHRVRGAVSAGSVRETRARDAGGRHGNTYMGNMGRGKQMAGSGGLISGGAVAGDYEEPTSRKNSTKWTLM